MMMVRDARHPLGRQAGRANESPPKLHNPKLEADLYPVGSWRDHPPTGELIDLSQPHPAPPITSDDDDDDRTVTRLVFPQMPGAPSLQRILPQGWESTDLNTPAAPPSSTIHNAPAARPAPTTGSSPASTPPAESRCSRTTCTCPHRAQHLVHGRPERARLSCRRRHAARHAVCHRRTQ